MLPQLPVGSGYPQLGFDDQLRKTEDFGERPPEEEAVQQG